MVNSNELRCSFATRQQGASILRCVLSLNPVRFLGQVCTEFAVSHDDASRYLLSGVADVLPA